MSEYKYKTSVYIGRFQPFHLAHLETVKIALNESENIIIAIGSSNRPRTVKNPWTADERQAQICIALTEAHIDLSRVKFIHNRDYMYNDTKWVGEVYSRAVRAGATTDKSTCLIGHFKDDSSFYLKMYPMWDLHSVPNFYEADATTARNHIFDGLNPQGLERILPQGIVDYLNLYVKTESHDTLKDEHEFLKRYRKEYNVGPHTVFVTVDSIVVKSGCVLLVQRKTNPGKGLWAMPGGFLNSGEKLLRGALRELKEETRIDVDKVVLENNIIESKVFDHPYRSLRARIITHAFLVDLGIGPLPDVRAADDAKDAVWIPLVDLAKMEDQMFEDHFDILINMTSRF